MIWQNDKSCNGPLCSSRLAPGRNWPFYLVRFPPFFQTIRNVLKRIFLLLFQNDASLSTCIRPIFQRSCSLEYHNEVWNGKANCASQIGLLAASNWRSNKLNKRTSWARPTCSKIQGFPVQRQMEEQSLQSYFPSENYQISVNSVSGRQRKRNSHFKFQRCAKSFRAKACGIRFHYFTPGEIQTGIFVQMDETTRSH